LKEYWRRLLWVEQDRSGNIGWSHLPALLLLVLLLLWGASCVLRSLGVP
jgi:hypothetical protein